MLNDVLGERQEIDGEIYLLAHRGRHGHALYGPYERRNPGHYTVEFSLSPADGEKYDGEGVCAFIDVTTSNGQRLIAHDVVWSSSLRNGPVYPKLFFSLEEPLDLEYRVYVIGTTAILVGEQTVVRRAADPVAPPADEPYIVVEGIKIRSTSYDDIHFVDEVFYKKAYNVIGLNDACVIDIGMNVGLASLLFAKMPNVREVHAFEPFPETYERAAKNLQLNPELAVKVAAHPFGLAAESEELIVRVQKGLATSGGWSLRSSDGTHEVVLDVRDAAAVLGPIVAEANAAGRQVLAKVDCEGSEFDIFASLARADLFGSFTAFIVEWHRVFGGRDQHDLIAPLIRAGFIVIDLSPDEGNGFFYAIRSR